jgi:hypothetical protein
MADALCHGFGGTTQIGRMKILSRGSSGSAPSGDLYVLHGQMALAISLWCGN